MLVPVKEERDLLQNCDIAKEELLHAEAPSSDALKQELTIEDEVLKEEPYPDEHIEEGIFKGFSSSLGLWNDSKKHLNLTGDFSLNAKEPLKQSMSAEEEKLRRIADSTFPIVFLHQLDFSNFKKSPGCKEMLPSNPLRNESEKHLNLTRDSSLNGEESSEEAISAQGEEGRRNIAESRFPFVSLRQLDVSDSRKRVMVQKRRKFSDSNLYEADEEHCKSPCSVSFNKRYNELMKFDPPHEFKEIRSTIEEDCKSATQPTGAAAWPPPGESHPTTDNARPTTTATSEVSDDEDYSDDWAPPHQVQTPTDSDVSDDDIYDSSCDSPTKTSTSIKSRGPLDITFLFDDSNVKVNYDGKSYDMNACIDLLVEKAKNLPRPKNVDRFTSSNFYCLECSRRSRRLRIHWVRHHGFDCNEFLNFFTTITELAVLKFYDRGVKDIIYLCTFCSSTSRTPKRHHRTVHRKENGVYADFKRKWIIPLRTPPSKSRSRMKAQSKYLLENLPEQLVASISERREKSDAADKSESNRKQEINEFIKIFNLIKEIQPTFMNNEGVISKKEISTLFSSLVTVIEHLETELKLSTINHYLFSFSEIIKCHLFRQGNSNASYFNYKLRNAFHFIKRQQMRRRGEKIADSSARQITAEHILDFKSSEVHTHAIHFLEKLRRGSNEALPANILSHEYLNIVAVLVIQIITLNSQWPYAITNMTIRELEAAKHNECLGLYTVQILEHQETKGTFGPAKLHLPPDLFQNLEVYIKKVRPFYAKEEETVFVNTHGGKFSASGLLRTLQRYWAEGTAHHVPNFSFTMIRHGAASLIQSRHPALVPLLAEQMTPSSSSAAAASKHYSDLQGATTSQEVFSRLFQALYGEAGAEEEVAAASSSSSSHDGAEEDPKCSPCAPAGSEVPTLSKASTSFDCEDSRPFTPRPKRGPFTRRSFSAEGSSPGAKDTHRKRSMSWRSFSPIPRNFRKQFFTAEERKRIIEVLEPLTENYSLKLSVATVQSFLPHHLVTQILRSKFPPLTGAKTDQQIAPRSAEKRLFAAAYELLRSRFRSKQKKRS